jgi:hypothetical protein
VGDARKYPYRIRCAKLTHLLKAFKKWGKPGHSRAGVRIMMAGSKSADSDYPVKR